MANRKNVIFFFTDQQRADSLGCMGNALARTPNLDALAARGVLYSRCYSANPVCMPARASVHTGQYPQSHRLIDNGIDLPADTLTVAEVFRQSGYRTASFGKLHFQTYHPYEGDRSMESMGRWDSGELDGWTGPYYGFQTVGLTVAHGEGTTGHYGRWRKAQRPDMKLGPENALQGPNFPGFICHKSALPEELHHSRWVADRAVEFLDGHSAAAGEQPFFLHVSFPDPHHPFTPPEPWSRMFDDVKFPPPHAVPGENDAKPLPYRQAMTGNPFPTDGGARFRPDLAEAYQQIMANTYAMTALVDDCIGWVLAALRRLGLEDDTVIAFSSDHGDFLGDHHFIYKGQLPCRSLLNVPLIIVDPAGGTTAFGRDSAEGVPWSRCVRPRSEADTVTWPTEPIRRSAFPGQVCDDVVSHVDIAPTLLWACGLEIPPSMQGSVLPNAGRVAGREYAFEAGWSKSSEQCQHYSLIKRDWRLSVFPYLRDGELYDLTSDPWEHCNLFHHPDFVDRRRELMEELLYAAGQAEPRKPKCVTVW